MKGDRSRQSRFKQVNFIDLPPITERIAKMKANSVNIRGFNNNIKQKWLLSLMNKVQPDILLLQETHIRQDYLKVFPKPTPFQREFKSERISHLI